MMPMMRSMTLLRTIVEKRKMSSMTAMAPMKAAARTATNPVTETLPAEKLPPSQSMTRATPSPAPLLIPKTLGPARGLRKAVWSMSPLTASALPASIAVRACGSRDCRMMNCHEGLMFSLSPSRMRTTSSAGMDTEPTRMLRTKSNAMSTARRMQYVVPLFIEQGEIT